MSEHEKQQKDVHPSTEEKPQMTVPTPDLERLVEALSHMKAASDQQINDTIGSIFPGVVVVAPTRFASVKVLPFIESFIVTGEAFIEFTAASGFDGLLVFTVPQDNAGTPLLFPAPTNVSDATAIVFPTLILVNTLNDSGTGLLGAGVTSVTAVTLADRVMVFADLLVSGNNTLFRSIGFQATILAQ